MQTQTCSRPCQGWATLFFDLSKCWYSPKTNTGFTQGVNKEKAQWWVGDRASVGKNWVWDYVRLKPLLISFFLLSPGPSFLLAGAMQLQLPKRLWSLPIVLGKYLVCLPFCVVWFRGRMRRGIKQAFLSARLHLCLLLTLALHSWNSFPCQKGELA